MKLIKNFIKRSIEATDERNKLVHGFWCTLNGFEMVIEVEKIGESWPLPADLDNLASKLNKLADELNGARRFGWLKKALEKALAAPSDMVARGGQRIQAASLRPWLRSTWCEFESRFSSSLRPSR